MKTRKRGLTVLALEALKIITTLTDGRVMTGVVILLNNTVSRPTSVAWKFFLLAANDKITKISLYCALNRNENMRLGTLKSQNQSLKKDLFSFNLKSIIDSIG